MQHLSIHQFSSFRWSFFQDVVRYAGLGFNSIGLWRSKVEDFGFEAAAGLLYEMRMDVSSLSWAGGFSGSEGNSFDFVVEDAIQSVYQAHMVGAKKLIVYPGGRNGHTESHAKRLLRQGLQEMLPIARDLEIQLLLEPMVTMKNPWNFMTQFDDYAELLDDYCPSEVGLVVDLFHVGRSRSFAEKIGQLSDRIELVQLADGKFRNGTFTRCKLGDGVVPLEAWIRKLDEFGFDGDIEIELHGPEFENENYATLFENCDSYFAQSTSNILSST